MNNRTKNVWKCSCKVIVRARIECLCCVRGQWQHNVVREVCAESVSVAHVSPGAPVAEQLLRELLAKQPVRRAAAVVPGFPLPILDVCAAHVYGRGALDIEQKLRLLVYLPVTLGLPTHCSNCGLLCLRVSIRVFQKANWYATLN